jgi:hypothetical protein
MPFFGPSVRTFPHQKHRAAARSPLRLELLENRVLPTVYMINSLADGPPSVDGQLTLREAILAATTNAPSGDAPAGSTVSTGSDLLSLRRI